MTGATILFADIVKFSKKPTAEQRRLVSALTVEVIHELREFLAPPMENPSILAIPTGDGMALAFLHVANKLWDRTTILQIILRVQRWAHLQTTNYESVSMRIGVHVGPVELITDINGRPNVCGDTINFAQRVMDAANPRQVLFSDAAFREYIGSESPKCITEPFSEERFAEFHGPIEVYAKHGQQILVYKMTLYPEEEFWTNDDPDANRLMLVKLTELPKEIIGKFAYKLEHATHIAFIMLTGDRFLADFKEGKVVFSPSLQRFWAFMPDPETYANLHLSGARTSVEYIKKSIFRWKELFAILRNRYPNADLKLGLFKYPPYLGASFIDWERPDGMVHVSPYVWGIAAPDCPGYDLEWIGKKPSPIYEVYVYGLQYLNNHTENIAFQDNSYNISCES